MQLILIIPCVTFFFVDGWKEGFKDCQLVFLRKEKDEKVEIYLTSQIFRCKKCINLKATRVWLDKNCKSWGPNSCVMVNLILPGTFNEARHWRNHQHNEVYVFTYILFIIYFILFILTWFILTDMTSTERSSLGTFWGWIYFYFS